MQAISLSFCGRSIGATVVEIREAVRLAAVSSPLVPVTQPGDPIIVGQRVENRLNAIWPVSIRIQAGEQCAQAVKLCPAPAASQLIHTDEIGGCTNAIAA